MKEKKCTIFIFVIPLKIWRIKHLRCISQNNKRDANYKHISLTGTDLYNYKYFENYIF